MRKALFVGVLLAGLVYAAPAAAGCWATVQLAPPPAGTKASKTWTAQITVLQHGRNPLPDASDARPNVTITNAAGDKKRFTAKPVAVIRSRAREICSIGVRLPRSRVRKRPSNT